MQGDSLHISWYESGKILTYLNATCANRAADGFVTKLGIDHLVETAFRQNLLHSWFGLPFIVLVFLIQHLYNGEIHFRALYQTLTSSKLLYLGST